jgi:nucleoside-diphosphate-sugar epimerase
MKEEIEGYANKTVAVTGASGYLASCLIDLLKKTPAKIVRVSRQALPHSDQDEVLKLDLSCKNSWIAIVAKADVVFHLAGNTSVYSAARHPSDNLRSTVLPITHLVAAARDVGRKIRVVFASTATVYGLAESFPIVEDTPTAPTTIYDLHKLFAEKQLKLASDSGVLEFVSLRLANVYGVSSRTSSAADRGVLNKITMLALQGRELQLYGDGNYLRDYVYVDDVARAFMVAGVGRQLEGRAFNVASGNSVTVSTAFRVVAELVERFTGNQVRIKNVSWPEGVDPIELRNFVADISTFKKCSGWGPTVDLEEGVSRMINHFSKHTSFEPHS